MPWFAEPAGWSTYEPGLISRSVAGRRGEASGDAGFREGLPLKLGSGCPAIREQLRNYERMKELADRWIELSMELSNLRLARHKA